ncbi:hypothetical protein DYB32_004274 [Aphanomyces invadans]|uniref:Kinesin-like protein n=1 Tax=Aphanomyces invadans TaxID=157072 RepID=A0A3R7AA20_9STRA|nr:hypothetical protein DYB32_004274 [Aphanomyces invadans]
MHRIPSTEDKKRDRSLSVSLSSSSFVSPQRRQPKKKPMLDRRETLLGLSATPTAHPLFPPSIDATAEVPAMDNGYPETPEYFRQQRNKRIPTVPRVSPLHAKAMPSTTAPAPALKVDQQSFLQTRVHSLTQALIKSNQHHKRTQEHLTWALEEHALVQLEKQQLQAQLSYMKSLHNGDRAPPTSSLGNYDDDYNDVDMFLEGTSLTPTMSLTAVAHQLRQENDALKAVFASHPLITSALDGYNVCVLAYGQVQMHLSVLQVYNEKVLDLVQPSPVPLDIRVDKKLGVTVPNRTWVRRTKPSSTHARHGDVVVVESKINLVDLAGSERLGSSNSVREAQHINKSLLALRHVLLQLKNKQDYVSYRDSKLTLLLQDAIGGHAKTLLFVCVNPAASCAHETKCSLAFGERANAVELGRAKQHVNTIHRGNSKNV